MPTSQTERLNALARQGAKVRLKELLEELDFIRRTFPDLKGGTNRQRPARATAAEPAQEAAAASTRSKPVRKRGWTAAQRKAQAAKMKAYWAKRKRA
jgi:hypothetical protein